MFMKKGIITSVEITGSHVKVLQSKTLKGKTVVCSSDIHSLSSHEDEEIERVLSGAFKSKKVSHDGIVLAIPRRFAFVKHMRLPSNDDSEIMKMVELQVINKTPYSRNEIFFKPYILEKERSGYAKLIVLIVPKEIVERYLKIFEKIGIILSKVTLSSLGILNWHIYQESKNKKKTKGVVVLINVDVLHSEICFCHDDKLVFSRSINYGSKDLTEDKMDDIVEQIKLSIDSYSKENVGPNVDKVKIFSDLKEAAILRDRLKDGLDLESEVIAPFENILCEKNMTIAGVKNPSGVSLTVGLGLLLSDIKNLVNLTPQEVHDNKDDKQRKLKRISFFVLFILCFSVLLGSFGLDLDQKKGYLNKLKKRTGEVAPEVEAAINRKATVEVFDKEFKNRVFVPALIDELYKLTPQEISYNSLLLTERNKFTVQGYSETGGSVNDLRANMVKSSMFKEVNLQFATKRRFHKVEITDFKIIAVLSDGEQD